MQALTVIIGQVVTERNVSLMFSGEQHNGCFYALFPFEEKEWFGIFGEV